MKILVACEFSGRVRDAFIARGHNAISCDLLPSDTPGPHYQGDVLRILDWGWDMMLAFPPCTYLCNAGLHYLKTQPDRKNKLEAAFQFFINLWQAPIDKVCLENPVGWLNTHWQKPSQIVQPYYFGEPELKTTCLWLRGLPLLNRTNEVERPKPKGSIIRKSGNQQGKIYNYYWRQGKTAKRRSTIFQGVADAMAAQWG